MKRITSINATAWKSLEKECFSSLPETKAVHSAGGFFIRNTCKVVPSWISFNCKRLVVRACRGGAERNDATDRSQKPFVPPPSVMLNQLNRKHTRLRHLQKGDGDASASRAIRKKARTVRPANV